MNAVNQYSPALKDDLVRIYNFIERFKEENDNFQFTKLGVQKAYAHLMMESHCGERYAEKFLQLLPEIKWLAENQPTHVYINYYTTKMAVMVKYHYYKEAVEEIQEVGVFEYKFIKKFDEVEADYQGLKLFNRNIGTTKKVTKSLVLSN